tara:strand:+ start:14 stop:550 length:537 start_codon:yes stop_codon:yes gene_type:complete
MSQLKVDSIVPRGGLPSGAQGGIIQMKYTQLTTQQSLSTSEAGTNLSSLDTTITPSSSSSRIIIQCFLNVSSNGGNTVGIQIRRGSSFANLVASANGNRRRYTARGATTWNGDGNHMHNYMINVMDAPATTSSTTYKAFFAVEGNNTVYLNRNRHDSNSTSAIYGATMSTMLVMEVSG